MKKFRTHLPVLLTAFFLAVQGAHGQETRKMVFALGTAQDELRVEIEYHDPGEIDERLKGSRVLPIKLSATNISSRPVVIGYSDFKLNVNGNQTLSPVEPSAVADEIRRMTNRVPRLLNFIVSQSSAFHRTVLDRIRLNDGSIEPGQKKEGFLFYLRPKEPGSIPFNGVMWLDMPGYSPQALETKAIGVRTAPKPGPLDRIRQIWQSVVNGEFPYRKSYALLIGIGKYRHLRPLSSPALDVRKMETFLVTQGFEEIMVIEDDSVTKEMFQHPQRYFRTKIQPEDRFLFYYSGHGVSVIEDGKPKGYLPLVHERKDGRSDSVAMDDLVSWMKTLNAKHLLVIMDACFSGLAVEGIETHGPDRAMIHSLASGPARYLLMAGTESQESIADQRWNGSLFTEMIIRGVQTGKFEDKVADKIIATHALYGWVRPIVSNEAIKVNRQLTPLLKDLANVSKGEFLFFRK